MYSLSFDLSSGSVRSVLVRALVLLVVASVALAAVVTNDGRVLHKKSFSSIGCLGAYDKSKFARLEQVCDECYQIYRTPEISTTCREFCFKNEVFPACVDALLLSHEQKELGKFVDELLG